VISEGSCDTEDWSNDAENTALITGINYSLTYIYMEIMAIIFHNFTVFTVFFIGGQKELKKTPHKNLH